MRRAAGAACAVASSPGWATELTNIGTPKDEAALATAAVPPALRFSIDPTGASTTGNRAFLPKTVADVSTWETSRSTRGRNASESSARRLRFNVVSVSPPPVR